MQILSILSVAAAFSLLAQAAPLDTDVVAEDYANLPEPGTLVKRINNNSGQTAIDAIDIRIDCSNFPDICEEDCYAILCLGKERIL
jgi:hypothetical protein